MKLPNPPGEPIFQRFSPEDVQFIREWLLSVDEQCPTVTANVLYPPTLIFAANLLKEKSDV